MSGEFTELNTVERAIKTEINVRTQVKGVGNLSWFMSTITSPPLEGEPAGTGDTGPENFHN